MDKYAFNNISREEIHKKLEEHIRQILEKPTISTEEHALLERVDRLYDDSEHKDSSWLFATLFYILFGFGGVK